MSIGKVRANRSGSRSHPQTTWGDSDEVAQVSITSGSAVNPPGWSRWSSVKPVGTAEAGSTGSDASSASTGSSYSSCPSSSSRYHTGKGTPKNRCRLTSQSPCRPDTQFS